MRNGLHRNAHRPNHSQNRRQEISPHGFLCFCGMGRLVFVSHISGTGLRSRLIPLSVLDRHFALGSKRPLASVASKRPVGHLKSKSGPGLDHVPIHDGVGNQPDSRLHFGSARCSVQQHACFMEGDMGATIVERLAATHFPDPNGRGAASGQIRWWVPGRTLRRRCSFSMSVCSKTKSSLLRICAAV